MSDCVARVNKTGRYGANFKRDVKVKTNNKMSKTHKNVQFYINLYILTIPVVVLIRQESMKKYYHTSKQTWTSVPTSAIYENFNPLLFLTFYA